MNAPPKNVVGLPGFKSVVAAPNEAVIEAARDILARAESGDLQSLLAVGANRDRTIMVIKAGQYLSDIFENVGALELLKLEVLERYREEAGR